MTCEPGRPVPPATATRPVPRAARVASAMRALPVTGLLVSAAVPVTPSIQADAWDQGRSPGCG